MRWLSFEKFVANLHTFEPDHPFEEVEATDYDSLHSACLVVKRCMNTTCCAWTRLVFITGQSISIEEEGLERRKVAD